MNPFKTKLSSTTTCDADKDEEVVYPKKEPVTSAIMYLDRARSGMLLRFNILYWGLEYDELEYDNDYVHFDPSLNWSLVVTKRKDLITVVLLTRECKTMIQGFVVYRIEDGSRRHSYPIIAEEVADKRYKIEFPNTLIHDEGNEILKEKCRLVLGFMFDAKRLMYSKADLYLEERNEKNSFMVAYEKRLFTDFVIRSKGKEFHIHKAILAARSTFFYHKRHRRKKEITLDASSKTVQSVIHYLYSGKLPLLSLNELIDVFELSVKLFITSLVDLCSLYLDDVMTADKVGRIRYVAIRTGTQQLIGAANRICSRTAL